MAELCIRSVGVCINSGGIDKALEDQLEKLFPQVDRSNNCRLKFEGDAGAETLYINVEQIDPRTGEETNLFMLCIENMYHVDALRRHCEMLLDHVKRYEDREVFQKMLEAKANGNQ